MSTRHTRASNYRWRYTENEWKEYLVKAIALLIVFMEDYQFDPDDPGYLGFINVGMDLLDPEDAKTFRFICEHPLMFEDILYSLGGMTERGFDEEETVIRHLKDA
jgi:hypothetical protein